MAGGFELSPLDEKRILANRGTVEYYFLLRCIVEYYSKFAT